jgi:hypothetical protein
MRRRQVAALAVVLGRPGGQGREKADPRQLQQVIVDRLKLVRQQVDPGDGETEVRVELVGDAERVRLQAETNQPTVNWYLSRGRNSTLARLLPLK